MRKNMEFDLGERGAILKITYKVKLTVQFIVR
jgi:hypothetical protein